MHLCGRKGEGFQSSKDYMWLTRLKKRGSRPYTYQWLIGKYYFTFHMYDCPFQQILIKCSKHSNEKENHLGIWDDGVSEMTFPITFLSRGIYFRNFEFPIFNSKNYSLRGRVFCMHCFLTLDFFSTREEQFTTPQCFLSHGL